MIADLMIAAFDAPGFIFEEDDNRAIELDSADAADKEPAQQTIWKVRSSARKSHCALRRAGWRDSLRHCVSRELLIAGG